MIILTSMRLIWKYTIYENYKAFNIKILYLNGNNTVVYYID